MSGIGQVQVLLMGMTIQEENVVWQLRQCFILLLKTGLSSDSVPQTQMRTGEKGQSEQYKFIEHCLHQGPAKAIMAYLSSHPIFGYSSNKVYADEVTAEEPMERESLQKLWQKYKVDIALFGLVHNYERTCPIYQNTCTRKEKDHFNGPLNGTIHVVAGASLTKFSGAHPKWSLCRDFDYGFVKLTAFDHSNLLFEYKKNSDGKVYDSFKITRDYGDILACAV